MENWNVSRVMSSILQDFEYTLPPFRRMPLSVVARLPSEELPLILNLASIYFLTLLFLLQLLLVCLFHVTVVD